MKNINSIILITILFFIGFYCSQNLQKANATVKAPDENNQTTESTTNNVNPHRKPEQPPIINDGKKTIITQPPKIQGNKETPANKTEPASNKVQNNNKKTLPTAAATNNGVTLYSLSSSILVDIERIEEDLAALKNKVIILNNMR